MDSGGEGFRLESEIEKAIPGGMIHDSPIWKAFSLTVENLDEPDISCAPIDAQVTQGVRKIPSERLSSLFYTIRSVVSYSHPGMVWSTAMFFVFGILLFAVVLLQNLNYVLVQLNGGTPLIILAT